MQIEPFGIVVLIAGVLALLADYRWVIILGFAFTVFGAAGAMSLPALGGATITPPHLFSVFLILKALWHENGIASLLDAVTLRKSGGWLAFVAFYGIFVSLISPGLFPDTLVYAFGRLENGVSVRLEPLKYGSGQITQGIYAIGDVLLFAAGTILVGRPGAGKHVLRAFTACAMLNLLFAGLDLISFYSGNADLLSFLRTGGYAQLYSGVEGGLKRIVGSFTEASAFAGYSCILLGFWSSLWMQHYRPRLSGTLAFLTLAAMLLSTSSTAYVAIATLFSLLIASDLSAALLNRKPQRLAFIVVAVPVLTFAAMVLVLAKPEIADAVLGMLDETVFNKANSASGIERFAWNSQAWQGFLDTNGLGIGIGAGRASSLILIFLSNVGLIGTLGFTAFVVRILRKSNFHPDTSDELAIGTGCRWAFAAALIAASISAGVFELGVLPYLSAAAAASIGFKEFSSRRQARTRPSTETMAASG